MTRARTPRRRTAVRRHGGAAMHRRHGGRRWVRNVRTVSTAPPPKTFSGSAEQIARTMASRRVSPKGLGSGIRMIQFFINRGGRNLPASRRRELERAKRILQERNATEKRGRAGRARRAGRRRGRTHMIGRVAVRA